MSNQVQRVQTNVPEAEMAQAFINGWRELFGTTPSKEQVAILMAQNALETSHRKYMYNYNIGNITHSNADNFDYYLSGDTLNGNKITVQFRAYPDLKTAVRDYLINLKKRGKGTVWAQVLAADPAGFSKALKQSNYYTGDEKQYTAGVTSLTKSFSKSDSYDKALSGNVQPSAKPATTTPAPASSDTGFLAMLKSKILEYVKMVENELS